LSSAKSTGSAISKTASTSDGLKVHEFIAAMLR
jgi:hypothetical protein